LEQIGEAVVVNLLHQRQQATEFAMGKAFSGKPVQIGARQVGNDSALVLAERHLASDQQFEFFRIHRHASIGFQISLKNTGILHAGQMTDHAKNQHTDGSIFYKLLKIKVLFL
jgi:hypothetical protein